MISWIIFRSYRKTIHEITPTSTDSARPTGHELNPLFFLYKLFINHLPDLYALGRIDRSMRRAIGSRRKNVEAVGGTICLLAGLAAAFIGAVLWATVGIIGRTYHPAMSITSTVLLAVAIPLILFAGACLDWAEGQADQSFHQDQTHSLRGEPWRQN